jgi:hypothetical protein
VTWWSPTLPAPCASCATLRTDLEAMYHATPDTGTELL